MGRKIRLDFEISIKKVPRYVDFLLFKGIKAQKLRKI